MHTMKYSTLRTAFSVFDTGLAGPVHYVVSLSALAGLIHLADGKVSLHVHASVSTGTSSSTDCSSTACTARASKSLSRPSSSPRAATRPRQHCSRAALHAESLTDSTPAARRRGHLAPVPRPQQAATQAGCWRLSRRRRQCRRCWHHISGRCCFWNQPVSCGEALRWESSYYVLSRPGPQATVHALTASYSKRADDLRS